MLVWQATVLQAAILIETGGWSGGICSGVPFWSMAFANAEICVPRDLPRSFTNIAFLLWLDRLEQRLVKY
jgi:hypothetical protein